MNDNSANTLTERTRGALLAVTAAALLPCALAGPAVAVQDVERAVVVQADNQNVIEVRVENGETRVVLDGKELPAHRVERDGRRIRILDEEGNEIKSFAFAGDDGGVVIGFGEDWEDARIEDFWGGEHPPVMLGINLGEPGPALRKHLELGEGETSIVNGLYEDLPAHKAGIEQYDIITAIDGREPASPKNLIDALRAKAAGDEIALTILRAGHTKEFHVGLEAFDAERMRQGGIIGDTGMSRFFFPGGEFEFRMIDPEKWRDYWVDPKTKQYFRRRFEDGFGPEFRDKLRELPGRDDLEDRLDGVQDRIKELKRMLNELMDEVEKERQ